MSDNFVTRNDDSISMTMLMTPDMANFSGKVHGGALLKILDQVAYACAAHYSGHYVVTLSVDSVHFKESIHVGELVTFYASVNYTGRSSMEVGVKVIAENIHERSMRHTNSCYLTMIAVDENGKPTEVPRLNLQTQKEKTRYIAGAMRRKLRQQHDKRLEEIHDEWSEHAADHSTEEIDQLLSSIMAEDQI